MPPRKNAAKKSVQLKPQPNVVVQKIEEGIFVLLSAEHADESIAKFDAKNLKHSSPNLVGDAIELTVFGDYTKEQIMEILDPRLAQVDRQNLAERRRRRR